MQLSPLTAISPIDGRYNKATNGLAAYFSEFALIKYRLKVEVEYFILLGEKKFFKNNISLNNQLRLLVENFSMEDATVIKNTEAITNHDVKAVEYFLKNKLESLGAGAVKEWVHFGLTSQDINNTSIPMLWKDAIEMEYLPAVINLQHHLYNLSQQWDHVPMLARTHGQAASPTRLGKELKVYVERLENQIQLFSYIPFMAKFGGATGNFNAHHVAYPGFKWIKFADEFVENKLGLLYAASHCCPLRPFLFFV